MKIKMKLDMDNKSDLLSIIKYQMYLPYSKRYSELSEIIFVYSDEDEPEVFMSDGCSFDFDYEHFPKNFRRYGKNKFILKLTNCYEEMCFKKSEIDCKFLFVWDDDDKCMLMNKRLEKWPD